MGREEELFCCGDTERGGQAGWREIPSSHSEGRDQFDWAAVQVEQYVQLGHMDLPCSLVANTYLVSPTIF